MSHTLALRFSFCLALVTLSSGCVLTKLLTVPMRVTGAVISIVPGVGNSVDEAIDELADTVDEAPF
jgi:hypothetical protein